MCWFARLRAFHVTLQRLTTLHKFARLRFQTEMLAFLGLQSSLADLCHCSHAFALRRTLKTEQYAFYYESYKRACMFLILEPLWHFCHLGSSPRLISIGQLHALLHLHLRPIYDVVYIEPYSIKDERSYLRVSFTLRCFQRLSLPDVATQLCPWQDNWCTRGLSIPVLSY